MGTNLEAFVMRARAIVGASQVLTELVERESYSCDGLAMHRVTPGVVVRPGRVQEIVDLVKAANETRVPFVPRGAGTGLSGGALPESDGVLIVTTRLDRILEIDEDSQIAVVEPGVVNADLSRAVAPLGLYYAPDPSSQIVCTIGGNVAENSGGAHCFKYGFTTHHVLGLELVTPRGEQVFLGGYSQEAPGLDLRGLIIGSEGTLGIVTKIVCRLLPRPDTVKTLMAYFETVEDCATAVANLVQDGIVPAALEMMDQGAMRACEAATGAGLDLDAGAGLLVEVDGSSAEVEEDYLRVIEHCNLAGARNVHVATTAQERDLFWRARKAAFAAAGRVAPSYLVQDGVIPRGALSRVLTQISEFGRRSGLEVLNVFHAGDGNLHPLICYDNSAQGQYEMAEQVAAEILSLCLREGGSLTGEHGIGIDKVCHMTEMFSEDDLAVFARLRSALDPQMLCNPGKLLPTPHLCGEGGSRRVKAHPLETAGVIQRW